MRSYSLRFILYIKIKNDWCGLLENKLLGLIKQLIVENFMKKKLTLKLQRLFQWIDMSKMTTNTGYNMSIIYIKNYNEEDSVLFMTPFRVKTEVFVIDNSNYYLSGHFQP